MSVQFHKKHFFFKYDDDRYHPVIAFITYGKRKDRVTAYNGREYVTHFRYTLTVDLWFSMVRIEWTRKNRKKTI